MSHSVDILQGTLDMLILKALSLKPLHGYGVLLRIQQLSKEALQIPQGSMYPAIYRLEHKGLISGEWGRSEKGRRAKFYRLTVAGRLRLETETKQWDRLCQAIGHVLDARPEQV